MITKTSVIGVKIINEIMNFALTFVVDIDIIKKEIDFLKRKKVEN